MAIEPRPDMLPDPSLNNPGGSEPVKTPEPVSPVPGGEPAKPAAPAVGGQTPESHLYAALQEERKLRKEEAERAMLLEQELAKLKSPPQAPSAILEEEDMSDEGKALRKEISALNEKMSLMERDRQLERLSIQYPALVDMKDEFEKFATDYPRHKLENVAKIFLAEKNLLTAEPARKGLERPTAGPKTPPSSKVLEDDVKRLRETQPRKYLKMLRDGTLKPEEIA